VTEKVFVCECGSKKHYAKGLCQKCYYHRYYQRPEIKARQKEYCQRPEVKTRRKEYLREYYQKPEVKARRKEYRREYHQSKVAPGRAVSDFFEHFSKKWFHSQEELQNTIQDYAENVCSIQGNCNNLIKKIKTNQKYEKVRKKIIQ